MRRLINHIPDRHCKASFTIEAAVIVPLTLIVLVSMIICGFRLHDLVLSCFTANEAAELCGHLPEDGDSDSIKEYGNTRLGGLLSDIDYELGIEEHKDGSIITITGNGKTRTYTDNGFRPETFMRKITVIEEVLEK